MKLESKDKIRTHQRTKQEHKHDSACMRQCAACEDESAGVLALNVNRTIAIIPAYHS